MFRPITTKLLHKGIHLNRTLTIGRRLPVASLQSANKPAENLLVSYIPGDGVYPELMEQVKTVFREAKYPITFQDCPMSEVAPEGKMTLPEVLSSIRKNKVCIKGIIQTPMTNVGMQNLNMQLRKSLDLFANVCRAHSLTGFSTRHNNLDIVVIREQTEGEYSALEHESIPGVVECLKIMTRRKCQHIAKFAFDFALRNGRKKVTAVHKANIMKLGDGLFLECVREVADLYPQIVFEAMIVDNCCMQLVSNPYQFDILVMPNLYGSIIDNLASGLVGGAGVVPGESYSHEVAIFEPAARHTYSAAKGQNIANPTAVLLSAVSMLRHVNLTVYAENLDKAIKGVIKKGRVRTRDLGGQSSTTEFTEAVIEELKKIQSQA